MSVNGGYATCQLSNCLDELLEAREGEQRMAEAYPHANIDDMREDGNDNIDMP